LFLADALVAKTTGFDEAQKSWFAQPKFIAVQIALIRGADSPDP
jgi:hypothetical protein